MEIECTERRAPALISSNSSLTLKRSSKALWSSSDCIGDLDPPLYVYKREERFSLALEREKQKYKEKKEKRYGHARMIRYTYVVTIIEVST